MGKKSSRNAIALRRRAEEEVRKAGTKVPAGAPGSALEHARLLHELQVHQIELELQNEELRKAETKLENILVQYVDLYENAPVGYLTMDRSGVIQQINHAGVRLIGIEKPRLIGTRLSDLVSPESLPGLEGLLRGRARKDDERTVQVILHRSDEGNRTLELKARVERGGVGYRILLEDITDRQRLEDERERVEERLRMSQKMEAIGTLAGGVAHDFNNILTVILNTVDFVLSDTPEGDPRLDDLKTVKLAAEKAADLTHQLLVFSRNQVHQPALLNLNRNIATVERMLRRLVRENVEFQFVLASDLGLVRMDPGQLNQVLINLVVNAQDAMPTGGTLRIETSVVSFGKGAIDLPPDLEPGSFVRITVVDTGCGMTEKTLSKIFEPFFTTKPKGKGVGFGLSTVYGIVKQSGGSIEVDSAPGQGSVFKIYLPREEGAAQHVPQALQVVSKLGGKETILLVDDEATLCEVAARGLEMGGYKVLRALDGESALRMAEEQEGRIHLLLTDVVMPRMNGKELAERLTKMRPDLKVLFMSGFTDDIILEHGVREREVHLIGKPFSRIELMRKVREVLDAPEEG